MLESFIGPLFGAVVIRQPSTHSATRTALALQVFLAGIPMWVYLVLFGQAKRWRAMFRYLDELQPDGETLPWLDRSLCFGGLPHEWLSSRTSWIADAVRILPCHACARVRLSFPVRLDSVILCFFSLRAY